MAGVLFIESYYGGSHKQLLKTIIDGIDYEHINGYQLFTLPVSEQFINIFFFEEQLENYSLFRIRNGIGEQEQVLFTLLK